MRLRFHFYVHSWALLISLIACIAFFELIVVSLMKAELSWVLMGPLLAIMEVALLIGIKVSLHKQWVWIMGLLCYLGLLVLAIHFIDRANDGGALGMMFMLVFIVIGFIATIGMVLWIRMLLADDVFAPRRPSNPKDSESTVDSQSIS